MPKNEKIAGIFEYHAQSEVGGLIMKAIDSLLVDIRMARKIQFVDIVRWCRRFR